MQYVISQVLRKEKDNGINVDGLRDQEIPVVKPLKVRKQEVKIVSDVENQDIG